MEYRIQEKLPLYYRTNRCMTKFAQMVIFGSAHLSLADKLGVVELIVDTNMVRQWGDKLR